MSGRQACGRELGIFSRPVTRTRMERREAAGAGPGLGQSSRARNSWAEALGGPRGAPRTDRPRQRGLSLSSAGAPRPFQEGHNGKMVELEGTCTIPVSSLTAEGKRSLRGGTFHGSGRAGPRPRPPVLAPSSSPRLAARLPRPARGADGVAATWGEGSGKPWVWTPARRLWA